MAQFIKILTIVSYFLPLISEVVRLVEGFAKGVLPGEEKKTRAIALLKAIYGGLQKNAKIDEIKDLPFEMFEGVLGMLIDSVVALANATGVFTSSSK